MKKTSSWYSLMKRILQSFFSIKGAIMLLLIVAGTYLAASPFQQSVSGKITSSSGEALPGVSIVVRGTTTGVNSDMDGMYTINVPSGNSTLVFSFIGYISKEVNVTGLTRIDVTLDLDVTALEEVIVVGYGTQKKSDITGTVASLPRERLELSPNLNIAQAIQGSIPGVMIQTTAAGAAPTESIEIRGRNSILASNDPLIVVDGIPYGGHLSDINPNDVKSIEILKDASAAAIYGSRGSNGVILISTNEGKEGKPTISYDGKYSIQNFTNIPDIMDGGEFYNFKMLRLPSGMTQSEQDVYDSGKWVNWLDLGLRKGNSQQHNLTVSGGTPNTKYYISGNFLNVKGLIVNDDFTRLSSRVNIDTKIVKWLSIGTRTQLTSDDMSGVAPDMGDLFYRNPLSVPYDENGNLTITPITDDPLRNNPLETTLFDNIDKSYQVVTNNYAIVDFPFVKGLSYRINTGITFRLTDQATYKGRDTKTGLDARGSASTGRGISNNTVIENILTYNKEIGAHTIFATALMSYEGNKYSSNSVSASGFPHDFLSWYSTAQAEMVNNSYSYNESTLVSQMLRLNYAYSSRYLITMTVRRDGYSGFGTSNKWGVFPSVALGWNLSNEKFFPLKNIFNELKLRFSYGLNGNQAVGAYESISRLSQENMVSLGTSLPGYKPSKLGSDNLGWESSKTMNFGLDFGIFENRVSGNLNLFRTNTTDLLLNRTISAVHGITSITQNIGQTRNDGVEFSVNSRNIVKKNFTWNTSGNISFIKNRIVSLYGDLDEQGKEIDDIVNNWFIGEPIRVNYGFVFDGVWQTSEAAEAATWGSQPGFIKIKDVNGDSKLTAEDRQIMGQRDPKMLWGLTNNFTYRNFSMSVFIHGVQGVTRQNDLMSDLGVTAGVRHNTTVKNWWTPANPSNDFWMNHVDAHRMAGVEAAIFESADFARLKDISLAYDLSTEMLKKLGLNKLKLYVTGRNLMTFTKWRGLDPELSSSESIPLQKEYVFGLNLSF
ncbi:MAG TPA: TonB-dependent receptor [Lentimicrobium sp.]|nr:TonB-dependent receptor [Lentimicrobium sp.]